MKWKVPGGNVAFQIWSKLAEHRSRLELPEIPGMKNVIGLIVSSIIVSEKSSKLQRITFRRREKTKVVMVRKKSRRSQGDNEHAAGIGAAFCVIGNCRFGIIDGKMPPLQGPAIVEPARHIDRIAAIGDAQIAQPQMHGRPSKTVVEKQHEANAGQGR